MLLIVISFSLQLESTTTREATMGKDIERAPSRGDSIDVGIEKVLASKDVDEALKFMRDHDVEGAIDDVDDKKLMRKVDWMVMVRPLASLPPATTLTQYSLSLLRVTTCSTPTRPCCPMLQSWALSKIRTCQRMASVIWL